MSLTVSQLSIAIEQLEIAAREMGTTPRAIVETWPKHPVSPRQQQIKDAILAKYPEPAR